MRIAKTNAILKRSVTKLFLVGNTCHDTNQTDKAREQKLRREVSAIGELKTKYECWLREHWEGEESLNITNTALIFQLDLIRHKKNSSSAASYVQRWALYGNNLGNV